MDIIQEVVKTEASQKALIEKTKSDLQQKLLAKQSQLKVDFENKKQQLFHEHDQEMAKLEKSFTAKKNRIKVPSYSVSETKVLVDDILTKIKWQLKQ